MTPKKVPSRLTWAEPAPLALRAEAGQSGRTGATPAERGVDELDVRGREYLEDEDEVDEYVDELGRRHVRRAAPDGTDEMLENEAPRVTGLPDRVEKWRRNSATGAVLTAFAFGLQQVFEPERKEPAIVMQTSGDPPKDLPVEAQLEQLGPARAR